MPSATAILKMVRKEVSRLERDSVGNEFVFWRLCEARFIANEIWAMMQSERTPRQSAKSRHPRVRQTNPESM